MLRTRLPLRLRLTAAFALAMALVLGGLGAFLYARLGAELLRGLDLDLRARAGVILSALGSGPVPIDAGRRLIDPDEAFAQVLDSSGRIVDSSAAVSSAPMLPYSTIRPLSGPTLFSRRVSGVDDPARLLAVPVGAGAGRLVIVVGAPLGDRSEALHRLLLLLTIGGPVALALSSAAGWAIAGAALRPVERMRVEAAAISASEPERRLAVPATGDELARLADTLNGMLGRLQESLERERRFVDDASHELRTPLSVLKAELDLSGWRHRSQAELEATVRAASAETDRLVRLAEDLLVLARTRRGGLPVNRNPVSLRDLLDRTASRLEGSAAAAGTRIEVAAPDDEVRLDEARIGQAVQNLLDNAIRHGGGGGPIRLSGERMEGMVRISVEDCGPGFPRSILDRAFEPFARGPSAGDGGAGVGLGLAIVGAIAEAHGGRVSATNTDSGSGCVVLEVRG